MIDLDAIQERDDISKRFDEVGPHTNFGEFIGDQDRRALLAYVRELLAVKDALLVAADVAHDDAVAAQAERDALIAAARKVTCKRCDGDGWNPVHDELGRVIGLPSCPDCADLRALLPEVKP